MSDQFDYPVSLGAGHRVVESDEYDGDRFECTTHTYTHTGAWPTWDYCPWCGEELAQ